MADIALRFGITPVWQTAYSLSSGCVEVLLFKF